MKILSRGTIAVMMFTIMVAILPLYSFTDQITTERILGDNKHFVEFINVALTNFGENYREKFTEAYRDHFNADVAFLQSDYKRSFKRVYSSQKKMVTIYEEVLRKYYLEESKSILDSFAPGVVKSKKNKARLYLTLGYRDREVSWTGYTIGEASNPKLFSYKLHQYEEAIKMARRSKRYAFLALFESQDVKIKQKIYLRLIKNESESSGLIFGVRFVGKDNDAISRETGVTYEEYETKIKNNEVKTPKYEKNLERRVRFRKEKRWGFYLVNNQFAKAEEVMRPYIDDFNFKLITATFQVLEEEKLGPKVDFARLKIHLLDNYKRLNKKSMLDDVVAGMTVEDAVKDEKKPAAEPETTETKTEQPPAENRDDAAKTPGNTSQ